MIREQIWKCAFFCGCCAVLPAAGSTPQQDVSTPASATLATAPIGNDAPQTCLDELYYAPLPGKTNYCLGVRDWKDGHYRNGLQLLKLAAGWGNKNAQYTLGLIYYSGRHVSPDPALGIAWLKLANERDNDATIALAMRSAIKWASAAQREHAQQLFQKMRQTYGDKVATARAWDHWLHWQQSHHNHGIRCLNHAEGYAAMQAGLTGAGRVGHAFPGKYEHTRGCVPIRLRVVRRVAKHAVKDYFDGWIGHVTVEPLQQVPAPATSSGR